MTLAEKKLWQALRNRGLDGLKFRRQSRVGRHIPDFVCLSAKLVVELDGGIHKLIEAQDAARAEVIERQGFFIVRFPNEQVVRDLPFVLKEIRRIASLTKV
jgi:very-short-patch-repair endonuclease